MPTKLTAAGVQFSDNSVIETNPIPSGTRLLFHNSTAPTGWTKDTSINDSALRVVSGTPGSGGSTGFSSALGSPTVTGSVGLSGAPGTGNLSTSISGNVNIGSTSLSTNQMPSHNHLFANLTDNAFNTNKSGRVVKGINLYANTNSGSNNLENINTVGNKGGSGSHSHNAGHNLSGNISGAPSIGNLSGSLSSASASINVKYQDFIIAQKD